MDPRPLRICQVSAELAPFAKTGGLGDVVGALCRYLHRSGHEVRAFLPFYAQIDTSQQPFYAVAFLRDLSLSIGPHTFSYSVYTSVLPSSDLPLYFVHCPALFDRRSLYTSDPDEAIRFAFLSRAAIECCQRMGWAPDVFHCHDWHASLAPLYLRAHYGWDQLFARSRTMLTLHNVGYQGIFSSDKLADVGLMEASHFLYQEDLAAGRFNFLKTGILYAGVLTTVSRTHAEEIKTDRYGMGLQSLLRARGDHLVGIVNGIDADEWNPEADPHLAHPYSLADLSGKAANKRLLLDGLGLSAEDGVPLCAVVSRLTAQKGFDLFFDAIPELLRRRDFRLAILGSGESRYEEFFTQLQQAFPGRVCFYRGYSEPLAHLLEAGSDIFLMPSLYEPCGLNQMYSQRYGTPPVVRRTGGLADTVEPFDRATGEGTGFVFEHYTPEGLMWAVQQALDAYEDREAWLRLMVNGMSRDFSWDLQIQKYVALYRALSESRF